MILFYMEGKFIDLSDLVYVLDGSEGRFFSIFRLGLRVKKIFAFLDASDLLLKFIFETISLF